MNVKVKRILGVILLIGGVAFLSFLLFQPIAHAVGLVDDTVNSENLYSQYPLANYQLDFYVDTNWDWLPWNWKDGIGNQVQYGLYAISDFLWTISLYLSNATGYLVQQAYKLDFISDTADQIGTNIQTLAGVSQNGFSTSGFYVGFLLLFLLILGAYVAYVGLIKRETSKALQAVMNFLVIFLLSSGFIAFAPSYIQKINEFSADISQASLDLGSKIILPHAEKEDKDSVDSIRHTLFSVQVEQPWLLLQFDNSNKEKIGEERVNQLLSVSPEKNNGKDREKVVKEEIEQKDNQNLTLPKTVHRLGTVVFLVLFNIGISIFVFLLTGILIFSQILFILYAMFLPISFVLSMLPTFTNMGKAALMKLFNTIMLRAGITLIITVAFSLSTMLYALSTTYPFFLVAFLQIVTFAGIYLKLGDIMSLFHLQASDSQQVGRSVLRRPKQTMYRGAHRLQRTVTHGLIGGTAGYVASKMTGRKRAASASPNSSRPIATSSKVTQEKKRPNTRSYQTGQTIGKVLGSKNRASDYIFQKKQQVQKFPQILQQNVQRSVSDLKQGITDEHPTKSSKKATRSTIASSKTSITNLSTPPKRSHQRPTTRVSSIVTQDSLKEDRSKPIAPKSQLSQVPIIKEKKIPKRQMIEATKYSKVAQLKPKIQPSSKRKNVRLTRPSKRK
ncbi:CD3337/EF1877 family mobilome membrane protein [Enterococcus faecalis]|uniref:CD3337/EF1877 family mobilome membrane protein n=1 Tax=Enterococcus faecalis TaxID=1351 RepID=UPI001177F8E6